MRKASQIVTKFDKWSTKLSTRCRAVVGQIFTNEKCVYPLKIVDVVEGKDIDEVTFVLQYTGRSLIQKFPLSELLREPKVLGALSPEDAKYVIHKYHSICTEIKHYKYVLQSIETQELSQSDRAIFLVLEVSTGVVYRKTSDEIFSDPVFYGQFSLNDWYTIARLNGIESVYSQQKKLKKLVK